MADSNGKSSCAGARAKAWPPLTASVTPSVTGGVNAADLSLISRSDGTKQVAYKGRPLYYYVGDTGAGTTNGLGSNGFGAKWWLLGPSGGPVGSTGAQATSGSASGSSGTGGSSTGSSGTGSSGESSGGSSGSGWG